MKKKSYNDEEYFITEKMQGYEKLFEKKLDLNGWKKFYDVKDNHVLKLVNMGKDKKKLKSYAEIIIKLKNKDCLYKGQIDEDNNIYGYGVLYNKNGEKYEGVFDNEKLNGWGRYINQKGTCYEGLFKNGILTGKGIIIKEVVKNFKKGKYYFEGDIKNFLKEGKGIEKTDDYEYEGDFKNDLKEGKGTIKFYKGGELYEGDFKKDEMTGSGTYTFSNKNTYKGEFLKGKMHGKGIYKWWNGNVYEGEYVNNVKEGEGEFIWNNGKIYKGKFSKGTPHGEGTLTIKGVSYDAVFEYGKFKGKIDDINQSKLDYESEC